MRSNCLVWPDGTGSPAELFFRRNMRVSGVPRATVGEVDFQRLQILFEEALALCRGWDTSKHYKMNFQKGDHVILQDPLTKLWDQRGVVVSVRDCTVPDASRSYLVDMGQARMK